MEIVFKDPAVAKQAKTLYVNVFRLIGPIFIPFVPKTVHSVGLLANKKNGQSVHLVLFSGFPHVLSAFIPFPVQLYFLFVMLDITGFSTLGSFLVG